MKHRYNSGTGDNQESGRDEQVVGLEEDNGVVSSVSKMWARAGGGGGERKVEGGTEGRKGNKRNNGSKSRVDSFNFEVKTRGRILS